MNLARLFVERRKILFLMLYMIVVTLLLSLLFFDHFYDDPFITYRYAYNLIHGRGFVYNPDLRVQSTTTPLFTLLLAAGGILGADIPHLAVLLSAFSLAISAVLLWYLANSWGTEWVGWAGLLLYPTFPLLISTISSETPLYLAFCIGAFTCYARRAYIPTAVLSALAVLTRPDGLLVPLILCGDFILRCINPTRCDAPAVGALHLAQNRSDAPAVGALHLAQNRSDAPAVGALHLFLLRLKNQIPWKAVLLFFLITLPWFLFAWQYFGTPIPATLFAKQQQGNMAISQRFAPGLITIITPYTHHWFCWLEAALVVTGIVYAFRRNRVWLVFLSWTALYFVSFALLGVSRYYWYYAPLVPGLVVLIGLGLTALKDFFRRNYLTDSELPPGSFPVSSILSILLLSILFLGRIEGIQRLVKWSDARCPIYRAVGEWLRTNTSAEATVGTTEVGIIGFYADRPFVEFAGLILPDIARQLKKESTYEDAALWAVKHYHPDYLVLHDGHYQRLEQDYVQQNCGEVQSFQGAAYGYPTNISIYNCKQPIP